MKKLVLFMALLSALAVLCSCEDRSIGIIGGADGPTAIVVGRPE